MNANLERTAKVLKHYGIYDQISVSEIAAIAGISRRVASEAKAEMDVIPLSSVSWMEKCRFEDDVLFMLFSAAKLNALPSHQLYQSILGVIATYLLRYKYNLMSGVTHTAKAIKVGNAFLKLLVRIQNKKDDGVQIHSQGTEARLVLTALEPVVVDALFERGGRFQSNVRSREWKLTERSKAIVNEVVALYVKYSGLRSRVALSSLHMSVSQPIGYQTTLSPLMTDTSRYGLAIDLEDTNSLPLFATIPCICSHKSVTLLRQLTTQQGQHNYNSYFTILNNDLIQLSLPSILQLLVHGSPSNTVSSIDVNLSNLAATDDSIGRSYNVFTRLRSTERTALGYINYDISGGIQIINFGILYRFASDRYREPDDLIAAFEMLFNYGWDPEYKRELRQRIAGELEKPVGEVKEMLTAYSNGSQREAGHSSELQQFKDESDLLRRQVLSVTATHNPVLLQQAINQSKYTFSNDLDWSSTDQEEPELARKKSSVFFFIWTYYEKQIRDAMLSLVGDGIPVHDAIYSKHNIPCEDFERVIVDQTGFEVKVSH